MKSNHLSELGFFMPKHSQNHGVEIALDYRAPKITRRLAWGLVLLMLTITPFALLAIKVHAESYVPQTCQYFKGLCEATHPVPFTHF